MALQTKDIVDFTGLTIIAKNTQTGVLKPDVNSDSQPKSMWRTVWILPAPVSHTGDLNATVIATATIPKNIMGTKGIYTSRGRCEQGLHWPRD